MSKKILIVGNRRYIGSRLTQILDNDYAVSGIDIGWYDTIQEKVDYRNLSRDFLKNFNVIIVLAGHSSVKSCAGDITGPWLNNVTNFSELIEKVDDQLVIYSSSSSVYGNNSPEQMHVEKTVNFRPVNNYDITKYALDLVAHQAITNGKKVVGLRYGTVNGWAPNLRVDVMINSMVHSAINTGKVFITNNTINRALLGIEDLGRAVKSIIENPKPGIYNLASFNTEVGTIGEIVAEKLNVELIENDPIPGVYDFKLDCSLFANTFNFSFKETPEAIIEGLVKQFNTSKCFRRDQYVVYQ